MNTIFLFSEVFSIKLIKKFYGKNYNSLVHWPIGTEYLSNGPFFEL
jgi:hypothetical protein